MEMKYYRILKADPLGEPFVNNHGKEQQSFWCQFEGVDSPVMVTKNTPNIPSLVYGQFGYLVETVSKKGNKFYKFKGQKAPEELEQPRYADVPAQPTQAQATPSPVHPSDQKDIPLWFAPFGIMIRDLHNHIVPKQDAPKPEVKDEPVTREELEDIFGEDIEELEIK